MSSAPSVPVEVGTSRLGGFEQALTADREMVINAPDFDNLVTGQVNLRNASRRRYGRCSPVPRHRRCRGTATDIIAARIRPAAVEMVDALDGPRHAGLAQHPDGRFYPLAPLTKECVHARRLPAGL